MNAADDRSHDARLHAPAVARNRDPLAAVLARLLPERGLVLEVSSGSGEHAVHFARRFPALTWQPTDVDPTALASIDAWRRHSGLANLHRPVELDVLAWPWPFLRADVLLNINMIHIAPWACCAALLEGAGRVLPLGAPLILYGPFVRGGRHTAPSNAAFDRSLRANNPQWGVRDLDAVTDTAAGFGLVRDEIAEMPANNLTVVFRRAAAAG